MDKKTQGIWGSIKSMAGKVLPILGNAIIPGVGGVAGSLIAEALDADPNDPADIEMKLANATPEQIARLKERAMDHKETLMQISADLDKAYIADTQDARKREIEIQKSGGSNKPMYILATIIVLGFFALVAIMIFRTTAIPESTKPLAYILLGSLAASFNQVVQYFFGSSKSSSDKTKMLTGNIK
jgi:hypothetical protein